jgi:hypothetical protein
MIDFLWDLRGTIWLNPDTDQSAVLDRIEQMLEKQRKPVIKRGSTSINFEEPLWSNFWSGNGRATLIYDRGKMWIHRDLEGRTLRYELRSLHTFTFCLVGALTFFVIGSLDGDFRQGLLFGSFAFGWVYGMNILMALIRVPRLIRRTARAE